MRLATATLGIAAALTIGAPATKTDAAVSYDFSSDADGEPVAPGSTVAVSVYLRETLSGGSASQLTADGGVFSFGLRVTRTTGDAVITGLERNPEFDELNHAEALFPAATAGLWAERSSIVSGPVPDASGRILLGTVSLLVGSAGTTSSFAINDFAGQTETVTYADRELDPLIDGGTFTVTAAPVPEPTALAGAAVAGVLLLRRRR